MAGQTPILESAIRNVRDFESFCTFLHDQLYWCIERGVTPEELTYEYLPEELDLGEGSARHLKDTVREIVPFREGQPWGIFLLETKRPKVYRTFLENQRAVVKEWFGEEVAERLLQQVLAQISPGLRDALERYELV